jgi:hypothetical protein
MWKALEWNNKVINVVLGPTSRKEVALKFPSAVEKLTVNGMVVKSAMIKDNAYRLQLEQGKESRIVVTLK